MHKGRRPADAGLMLNICRKGGGFEVDFSSPSSALRPRGSDERRVMERKKAPLMILIAPGMGGWCQSMSKKGREFHFATRPRVLIQIFDSERVPLRHQ